MWWLLEYGWLWLSLFIATIGVALLYDYYPGFRYNLKFAIYILGMQISALYIIPLSLFKPKDVGNMLYGVPLMRLVGRLIGLKWQISGTEVLAKDFPCVIICNHQTMLDVLAMIEMWPTMKKCAAVAKREIMYVLPFGLMAWLCGTVFINRGNSSGSQGTMSTTAEKIREHRTKLWIFPEGTRSKKPELLPFKKGAFHIAMMNKLPIVPVVISPYSFIDDKTKRFDSGTMKVRVLNPIDTSTLQYPDDVSKLAETCHELMNLEFLKLKQEAQPARHGDRSLDSEPLVNGIHAKSNGNSQSVSNGFLEKRTS